MPRCSDRPNDQNQTIHIQGGPFLSWGGGVGIGMKNFPPHRQRATLERGDDGRQRLGGLSFWARRGPDSQAGFRVLVGDKYTDDDISYLMYRNDPTMPRYCERVRECGCLNHRVRRRPPRGSGGGTGESGTDSLDSGRLRPDTATWPTRRP